MSAATTAGVCVGLGLLVIIVVLLIRAYLKAVAATADAGVGIAGGAAKDQNHLRDQRAVANPTFNLNGSERSTFGMARAPGTLRSNSVYFAADPNQPYVYDEAKARAAARDSHGERDGSRGDGKRAVLLKDADGYVLDDTINASSRGTIYAIPLADDDVGGAAAAADRFGDGAGANRTSAGAVVNLTYGAAAIEKGSKKPYRKPSVYAGFEAIDESTDT